MRYGLIFRDDPHIGVVADIRIFRQHLEQYQKYSIAGLERHQADCGKCGERAEAGSSEYLLGSVPVHFPDLEHAEADGLQYLERHQEHGGEYRLRAEGRCGERL